MIRRKVKDGNMKLAIESMDPATFYERITRKTVAFPQRITVVEAYAMSKAAHEKHLASMSEVAGLLRHGSYSIDTVIDRFDARDWKAVARGETHYSPPSRG